MSKQIIIIMFVLLHQDHAYKSE